MSTKVEYNSNTCHVNEAFTQPSEVDVSPPDLQEKDEVNKDDLQHKRSKPNINKDHKKLKWTILKNVITMSFAFSLLFTSFFSLSNLQSSLHREMGTISLGVIYVALVTSCLFVPAFVIKKLKPKWVVCLSMAMYSPYFAALYFPSYFTFIPAALIMGVAGAPLWAAKCTYLSKIAEKYGEIVGETYEVIVVRFFGIFFFFLLTSQVWGNLISSSVLSVGVSDFERSEEFLALCGANFCPEYKLGSEVVFNESSGFDSTNTSSSMPDRNLSITPTKIYIMTTIYVLLAWSASLFVALVVDPISRFGLEVTSSSRVQDLLMTTLRHMKKPYQLLIIPLTIWSGIEQGFLSADYTASFVTCGIGVHMVGYSYLCFGVSDAIFCLAFTPLIKYVHRVPIFTLGAVVNIVVVIVMFKWKPHPDDYIIFFLIPCLWGMADAVWQTQVNALYGVIFPGETEGAFSNYRLWESAGFILAYVISGSFCMYTKLLLVLLSLIIGMAGYYTIEICEWKKKRLH